MKGDTFDVDCEQWASGYECALCDSRHPSIGGALQCCADEFEDEVATDGGQVQRLPADSFGPTQQPVIDVLLEDGTCSFADLKGATGLSKYQLKGALSRLRSKDAIATSVIDDRIGRYEYRLTERVQRIETDGGQVQTVSVDDLGPTQREVAQGLLEHGPIKPRDLADHIRADHKQIRAALTKLGRRDLVVREETDCNYGTGAYRLTERVQEVDRDD